MTYENLFKLEQFINSKGLKAEHVEVKEETSFGMAFGLSWSNTTNRESVKGYYIVLVSISAKEADEMHSVLASLMTVTDYLHKTWFDYYEDGKFRIVISVSETKK